jgi:hypothetical protein
MTLTAQASDDRRIKGIRGDYIVIETVHGELYEVFLEARGRAPRAVGFAYDEQGVDSLIREFDLR